MRHILIIFLNLFGLYSYAQTEPNFNNSRLDSTKATITTKLNIPFGTICKLDIEIFDGDELQMKEYEGVYLLKINTINDKPQNDTLLMSFIDETGQFANENFGLFKLIYKKPTEEISDKEIKKLKKKYVGKKFTVMTYETGRFTGIPEKYFKYRPVKADTGFHFENYLVVVSVLTK